MRIIAGKHRGLKLVTLEGLTTRPTLDATKEAIFSSIGPYLDDFITLDVFGGSGALSLEALSRGAKKAYIFEVNKDAAKIIKKNTLLAKEEANLILYEEGYETALKRVEGLKFDLIFLDPPFRMKVIDELIGYIIEHDLLSEGGYIMAEYPKEDIVRKQYDNYKVKLCRRYSSSEVLILERIA